MTKERSSVVIYPLSSQVSDELKQTMRDQFGNRPKLELAQSRRSICRRCLHRFNPGERRLLFKYRPFQRGGVFAEAGPFIFMKMIAGQTRISLLVIRMTSASFRYYSGLTPKRMSKWIPN